MTSWAKNQIAKHLARFAKNIEPSQISLKFLRGEGELLNLELNEQVLTDLMELPPWLQLTKATCNRICAKIHWTSLKTDPIRLYLDCVEVEILASEEARTRAPTTASTHHKPSREKQPAVKASKYGFAEKVVDGMYVSINTVMVNFKASGFKASFSMSRLIVQSTTADWTVPKNLRNTRIKDEQRGQVLIFKEIRWGTMRLDADAAYIEAAAQCSVPLRLITNNSVVRLTIKKQLNDCALVSSRLEIILDDILWVLTQSQLLKLSSFVHFILKIRQKFLPLATLNDAERSSPPARSSPATTTAQRKSNGQYQGHGSGSNLNQQFTEYDVEETSYHLKTKRIDLHLCDDQTLDGEKHMGASKLSGNTGKTQSDHGGALLISISDIRLNHCPYHIAGLRRRVHRCDEEARFARRQWAQQLFDFFLKTEGRQLNQSREHARRNSSGSRRPVMHESFFLLSCSSFDVMEVTTNDHQEPKAFLSSDKAALFLPSEMNALSLDFTSYYFLGNRDLPVPPSNMFLKLNPVQLTFHPLTCVWINKFVQSVVAGFEWTKEFMTRETGPPEHLDLRIEALMPKVTIPNKNSSTLPHQEERATALQLQISQAVISNSRIGTVSSQSDLLMDLQSALSSKVYATDHSFPNSKDDMPPLPSEYWVNDYSMVHRSFTSSSHRQNSPSHTASQLQRATSDPRLIWCIWCEQLWLDFIGIGNASGRPVTFVDAVPIRFWISLPVLVPKISQADSLDTPERMERYTGSVSSPLAEPVQNTTRYANNSTGSLPGAVNARNTYTASLSGASSNSSLSIDSPESEPRARHPANGMHPVNSSNRRDSRLNRPSTEDPTENHPLRTSYSESDLLPAENQYPHPTPDSVSLQEFNSLPPSQNSDPPPPYYMSSPSSPSPSVDGLSNRRGSVTSLPPVYSPPAYDLLNSDEQQNAPPLPKKISLAQAKETMKDLLESSPRSAMDTDKVPCIGGLLQITKPTSVQLDHFQLIFLIRLQEMFSDVMQTISADTDRFKQTQSPLHKEAAAIGGSPRLSLHSSLPAVNLNLIIPPCNGVEEDQNMSLNDRIKCGKVRRIFESLQTLQSPKSPLLCDNTPDASSIWSTKVSSIHQDNAETSTLKDEAVEIGFEYIDDSIEVAKEIEESLSPSVIKTDVDGSFPTSPLSSDSHVSPVTSTSPTTCNSLTSTLEPLKGDQHNSRGDDHSTGGLDEVGISNESTLEADKACSISNVSSNEADDSSGISSTSESPRSAADKRSEPGSQRSSAMQQDNFDVTSSSRNTPMLHTTSEISTQTDANEVEPEEADERLVSLVSVKCNGISLGVQSENADSIVKVIVNDVILKEKGNIEYSTTLDHRLSAAAENKHRVSQTEPDIANTECSSSLNSRPRVMVRLVSGPIAESIAQGSKDLGFAHVKINGLNATLLLSNAENLGEFAEDEVLMPAMPFQIELNDCDFKLLDDKPRRYLSSPLPPPIQVSINSLSINRSVDGKMAIANGNRSSSPIADRTFVDNDELGIVLNNGDDSDGARNSLREKLNVVQGENGRLLQDLKLANARTVSLEEERDAILKVVEKLQQELMWSNNENDKLLEKVRNYKQYLKGLTRT